MIALSFQEKKRCARTGREGELSGTGARSVETPRIGFVILNLIQDPGHQNAASRLLCSLGSGLRRDDSLFRKR